MRRVSYPTRLLYARTSRRPLLLRMPQRPRSRFETADFDETRDQLRRDERERSEMSSLDSF